MFFNLWKSKPLPLERERERLESILAAYLMWKSSERQWNVKKKSYNVEY